MSTPELVVQTAFILNDQGRIVSTREPRPTRGPLFTIARNATSTAWAVRADLPSQLTAELDRLASEEPPVVDLGAAPLHAERYLSLLGGHLSAVHQSAVQARQLGGPEFTFPDLLTQPSGVVRVEDERLLQRNFRGWEVGEIAEGRWPLFAILNDGYPVSVCFSARLSDTAAAAGLETAEAFRGQGLGPCVTAAWALAIRATGRLPLYGTAWTNYASRAVARKLGLSTCAGYWSLSD